MKNLWRVVYVSDGDSSSRLRVVGGGIMFSAAYTSMPPFPVDTPMPVELYRNVGDLPKHRIEIPIWPDLAR